MTRRRPIDGVFRTWSDGQRVHLLIQFSGGNLGRSPVTMHATTDLAPARAAVKRHYFMRGEEALAGDPIAVEAMAARVGAFSAFRRLGRAAKGAVSLATAPVRALGGATVNSLKATANVANGVESASALTEYATRPLAWRPSKKQGGGPATSSPAAEAGPPTSNDEENKQTESEEQPMTDETSGNPRPQAKYLMGAVALLRRARHNPAAARHVQNIAKAAAKGHPGAVLAQAAIAEARKQQRQAPVPPPPPPPPRARHGAFPAWARGAA